MSSGSVSCCLAQAPGLSASSVGATGLPSDVLRGGSVMIRIEGVSSHDAESPVVIRPQQDQGAPVACRFSFVRSIIWRSVPDCVFRQGRSAVARVPGAEASVSATQRRNDTATTGSGRRVRAWRRKAEAGQGCRGMASSHAPLALVTLLFHHEFSVRNDATRCDLIRVYEPPSASRPRSSRPARTGEAHGATRVSVCGPASAGIRRDHLQVRLARHPEQCFHARAR